jgi:hypothetical protein
MATHSLDDEHETFRNTPVPPATCSGVHDSPPSLLTRIPFPTATQKVELGQSTDPSAPMLAGICGVDHVDPPSDETTISPAYELAWTGDTPTATHVSALGQATPSSVVFAVGMLTDFHVRPPSEEVMTSPTPAATQSLALEQVTALSSG